MTRRTLRKPGRADSRRRVLQAVAVMGSMAALIPLVNLSPLIDRYAIGQVLDMNLENTAVVWLSSALLLAIAGAAAIAAFFSQDRRDRIGWFAIASFFCLLSLDETASLHELAGELAGRVLEIGWLPSLYTWVIVVAPVAAVAALWMLYWMRGVLGPRTTETRMAAAAVFMWLLVPLLEAIDPVMGGPRVLIVFEESLELAGEILMLGALALHLTVGAPTNGRALLR